MQEPLQRVMNAIPIGFSLLLMALIVTQGSLLPDDTVICTRPVPPTRSGIAKAHSESLFKCKFQRLTLREGVGGPLAPCHHNVVLGPAAPASLGSIIENAECQVPSRNENLLLPKTAQVFTATLASKSESKSESSSMLVKLG